MATVQEAVTGLMEIVRGVAGINGATDTPPDNLAGDFTAVCWAPSGEWQAGTAGAMRGLHDLRVQVSVARRNLASDVRAVMPFVDAIPAAIYEDVTLGSTVDTFEKITFEVGPITWGEAMRFGVTFTLTGCKIRTAVV